MASIHLLIMAENRKLPYPYKEWGKKMYKSLIRIRYAQGENKTTKEKLAKIVGIPLDTLKYYISGRGKPKIEILLYFVFACGMKKDTALEFLDSLGFSKTFLTLTPYKHFYELILKNEPQKFFDKKYHNGCTESKAYVDKIINDLKKQYRNPREK